VTEQISIEANTIAGDPYPSRLISVDDHVIEPPNLWLDRCSRRHRDLVPRVERTRAVNSGVWEFSGWQFVERPDDPAARPADVWVYEDDRVLMSRGASSVGFERGDLSPVPITFEGHDMRPGCYDQAARLADMDLNNTEASVCFPSISRFCGQFFMNRTHVDVALECIRIYNDWMIDEWCGGAGHNRLIPLTLIPMWDPELAAREIERCAQKGSHSIAFSECPPDLELPSLYTDFWVPVLRACESTETVINMHIGSSSKLPKTSADAPHLATSSIIHQKGGNALIDWIVSASLQTYPGLRIALSEAQAGWLPFILERMDNIWERDRAVNAGDERHLTDPPSSYIAGRVYFCIFDDLHALRNRDAIGMGQLMFETDYPHGDSTWAYSTELIQRHASAAGLSDYEYWRLIRGNAIECYQLARLHGISR
jgi:predicted TIM-barrel fold metal-dependent hydrolase